MLRKGILIRSLKYNFKELILGLIKPKLSFFLTVYCGLIFFLQLTEIRMFYRDPLKSYVIVYNREIIFYLTKMRLLYRDQSKSYETFLRYIVDEYILFKLSILNTHKEASLNVFHPFSQRSNLDNLMYTT